MADSCPVSGKLVDSNICRAVAGFAAAAVVAGIATRSWLVFALLGVDFVMRGSALSKGSPLFLLASGLGRMMQLTPKMVDAAPKRFASRIGAVLSIAAAALFFGGHQVAGTGVSCVLGACATLESALGICVGCRMYAVLPRKMAEVLAR